jgi:hypothetical protein
MASGGLLGTIEDFAGVSLGEVFDIYKDVNQAKLNRSFQDSQNFINELNAKAAVELGRLQNQQANPQFYGVPAAAPLDMNKILGMGLVLLGVGGAIYLLGK